MRKYKTGPSGALEALFADAKQLPPRPDFQKQFNNRRKQKMKQLKIKTVMFAVLFSAAACLLSVSVHADNYKPVDGRISWNMPDSGEGNGGDTTDGGIRYPGNGH